jgi:hypothetical protein
LQPSGHPRRAPALPRLGHVIAALIVTVLPIGHN